jgi:hypothetical protein
VRPYDGSNVTNNVFADVTYQSSFEGDSLQMLKKFGVPQKDIDDFKARTEPLKGKL